MIGPDCSSSATPGAPILWNAGIVNIGTATTAPSLTAPDRKPEYFGYLRTVYSDADAGRFDGKYFYEDLQCRTLATIHDGSPYAAQLAKTVADTFRELGGEVVAEEAVAPTDVDMRPVLTEVAASGAQLVFFPIFQPAGDFVAEQSSEVAGLEEVVLMGADGLLSDTFVVLPQTEDMYFSGPQTPTTPAYEEFVARYQEAYGEAPIQSFHAHAYDATNMVFTAIEEAATDDGSGNLSIDMQALRDSLHSMTHEGLTGSLSCDEFGDCAAPNIDIMQNTAETADIAAVRANVLISYSAEQLGF